jgi:hypothetical protein
VIQGRFMCRAVCEHEDESSNPIKGRKFIDRLSFQKGLQFMDVVTGYYLISDI